MTFFVLSKCNYKFTKLNILYSQQASKSPVPSMAPTQSDSVAVSSASQDSNSQGLDDAGNAAVSLKSNDNVFATPRVSKLPFEYYNMNKPRSNSIPNFQSNSHFMTFLNSHQLNINKDNKRATSPKDS